MKAITVEPLKADSARYEEVAEPDEHDGSILVEAIAVGVCGTDVEIVAGKYGWAPEGAQRLVLGHESLGRVIDPGFSSTFKKGDLVVGIVRRCFWEPRTVLVTGTGAPACRGPRPTLRPPRSLTTT
jgi:glucose 1-dehydrogenase